MSKFEVSVPYFFCPYLEIEAETVAEAKQKYMSIVGEKIDKTFHKKDMRQLYNKDWIVKPICTKISEEALSLLEKYELPTENFIDASVCEVKKIGKYIIELVCMEFGIDEYFTSGKYTYLRMNNITIFSADDSGIYPGSIEEAKTFVWTKKGNCAQTYFFLDDDFNPIYLDENWKNDIQYIRVIEAMKMNNFEAVIPLRITSNEIEVRPFQSYRIGDSITYYYKDENDIKPYKGKKTQTTSFNIE